MGKILFDTQPIRPLKRRKLWGKREGWKIVLREAWLLGFATQKRKRRQHDRTDGLTRLDRASNVGREGIYDHQEQRPGTHLVVEEPMRGLDFSRAYSIGEL
jgi:hypothetical protein